MVTYSTVRGIAMRYSIAVFDLDGTLLDTLDDLHAAVNTALARAGYPSRTREEVRAFVGNGVERLIRLSLPAGTDEATVQSTLADFKAIYAAGCAVRTAPYPGVIDLLDTLRARGVRIAVVSNKFDAAVKELCARYFGDRVEVAVGEHPGTRKKPAPDTVYEALFALGTENTPNLPPVAHGGATVAPRFDSRCFSKNSPISAISVPVNNTPAIAGAACPGASDNSSCPMPAVYIGDSEVDIETARNAALPCLSVTWGFRDEATLRASGATTIVHTAEELSAQFMPD